VSLSDQRAKYGKVDIATRLQESLPAGRLFLSELQQVILNLINNALDATEKKGGKGAGLGLSICYGLVENMDGRIGCKAQRESELRFRCIFPF